MLTSDDSIMMSIELSLTVSDYCSDNAAIKSWWFVDAKSSGTEGQWLSVGNDDRDLRSAQAHDRSATPPLRVALKQFCFSVTVNWFKFTV